MSDSNETTKRTDEITVDDITVNTQSSIRINAPKEGVIYIDPFQLTEAPADADIVMITHDHFDHFSPEDIDKVAKTDTRYVFPITMQEKAVEACPAGARLYFEDVGVTRSCGSLVFETIAAYNRDKPHHPKGHGWLGYILRIGSQRIYVSGDTDITLENAAIKCDIAFLPIGGTYTMTAKEAAALVNKIQPKIVIPTHYGTIVGSPDDASVLRAHVKPTILVVEKIKF